MRLRYFPVLLVLTVALAACGGGDAGVSYPIAPDAAGESLYAANCQVCHASPVTGGERQFGAPRHDVDGHTWHHADRPLVEWVLDGIPGGSGAMPAFGERLTDAEVVSIIAYIKSTWPAEVQELHRQNSQVWEDQLGN